MRILVRGVRNNLIYGMVVSELMEKLKVSMNLDKPIMQNKIKFLDRSTFIRMGSEYDATSNKWVKKKETLKLPTSTYYSSYSDNS